MTTTTSEAANAAMQEARKKWMAWTSYRGLNGGFLDTLRTSYEAGWRAALAWAAKDLATAPPREETGE